MSLSNEFVDHMRNIHGDEQTLVLLNRTFFGSASGLELVLDDPPQRVAWTELDLEAATEMYRRA